MGHLQGAIGQARGLRELLPLVVMLSEETEAMTNGRNLSEGDIQQIAVPLAKIRFLLTTIVPLEHGPGAVIREDALLRDLIERYRNLEGRLKEMRNDRARANNASVP